MYRIKGFAMLEGKKVECSGVIKWDNKPNGVYASWHMQDVSGNDIAYRAREYFMGDDKDDTDAVLRRIIANIENYRAARTKVFSDIEVDYY